MAEADEMKSSVRNRRRGIGLVQGGAQRLILMKVKRAAAAQETI